MVKHLFDATDYAYRHSATLVAHIRIERPYYYIRLFTILFLTQVEDIEHGMAHMVRTRGSG